MIIIIIWCNIDSGDELLVLIIFIESLRIAITLTQGALLIFLQSGFEKLLSWLGIEPTTLDPFNIIR